MPIKSVLVGIVHATLVKGAAAKKAVRTNVNAASVFVQVVPEKMIVPKHVRKIVRARSAFVRSAKERDNTRKSANAIRVSARPASYPEVR